MGKKNKAGGLISIKMVFGIRRKNKIYHRVSLGWGKKS